MLMLALVCIKLSVVSLCWQCRAHVRTVSMPKKYLSAALCGQAFTSSSVCK
jgi:hypothetical protein